MMNKATHPSPGADDEQGYTPDHLGLMMNKATHPHHLERMMNKATHPSPGADDEQGYTPASPGADDEQLPEIQTETMTSIMRHRKAFIEWMNSTFYKQQIERHDRDYQGKEDIKIYQLFVKNYLDIQTPYRGSFLYIMV